LIPAAVKKYDFINGVKERIHVIESFAEIEFVMYNLRENDEFRGAIPIQFNSKDFYFCVVGFTIKKNLKCFRILAPRWALNRIKSVFYHLLLVKMWVLCFLCNVSKERSPGYKNLASM